MGKKILNEKDIDNISEIEYQSQGDHLCNDKQLELTIPFKKYTQYIALPTRVSTNNGRKSMEPSLNRFNNQYRNTEKSRTYQTCYKTEIVNSFNQQRNSTSVAHLTNSRDRLESAKTEHFQNYSSNKGNPLRKA